MREIDENARRISRLNTNGAELRENENFEAETARVFNSTYTSLRQDRHGGEGDWCTKGKRYSIKGVRNLVRGNTYHFSIDACVQRDLEVYENHLQQEKQRHERSSRGRKEKHNHKI